MSDFLKPVDDENWLSLDTENWSPWSGVYPFEKPDVDIISPSPRQFIQIRADFSSTIEDGGEIDYVEFKASIPPMVHRLVGEISPTRTIVGKPTQFTYYIVPTIFAGDMSFDAVEISTPSGVMSVDSLRIGGIDQGEFSWVAHTNKRGFEVILPRKLETTDSGAVVEIVFTS